MLIIYFKQQKYKQQSNKKNNLFQLQIINPFYFDPQPIESIDSMESDYPNKDQNRNNFKEIIKNSVNVIINLSKSNKIRKQIQENVYYIISNVLEIIAKTSYTQYFDFFDFLTNVYTDQMERFCQKAMLSLCSRFEKEVTYLFTKGSKSSLMMDKILKSLENFVGKKKFLQDNQTSIEKDLSVITSFLKFSDQMYYQQDIINVVTSMIIANEGFIQPAINVLQNFQPIFAERGFQIHGSLYLFASNFTFYCQDFLEKEGADSALFLFQICVEIIENYCKNPHIIRYDYLQFCEPCLLLQIIIQNLENLWEIKTEILKNLMFQIETYIEIVQKSIPQLFPTQLFQIWISMLFTKPNFIFESMKRSDFYQQFQIGLVFQYSQFSIYLFNRYDRICVFDAYTTILTHPILLNLEYEEIIGFFTKLIQIFQFYYVDKINQYQLNEKENNKDKSLRQDDALKKKQSKKQSQKNYNDYREQMEIINPNILGKQQPQIDTLGLEILFPQQTERASFQTLYHQKDMEVTNTFYEQFQTSITKENQLQQISRAINFYVKQQGEQFFSNFSELHQTIINNIIQQNYQLNENGTLFYSQERKLFTVQNKNKLFDIE